MNLQFERGDSAAPVGHALIYWRAGDAILATYVSVPPIKFDLGAFLPQFLTTAMQGMDLSEGMVAAPIPPIPEQVESLEHLRALAERRQDDLIFAGVVGRDNPMMLAGETAEAARQYGDLYAAATPVTVAPTVETERVVGNRFEGLTQGEQLAELTSLTGRLLDSLREGAADIEIEREMRQLAGTMPAKYRVADLIEAVHQPGERGRRLADLYIERCYKLLNEDYLDLERIDREIDATLG